MPKTLYLHIPKTAGTSFQKSVLLPAIGTGKVRPYLGIRDILKNRSRFDLLTGHYKYGIDLFLPRDEYQWVTFLREPLDQQISLYYFVKQCGESGFPHPLYGQVKNSTIVEFYRDGIDNLQTRSIAGFWYDHHPMKALGRIQPSLMLAHAKRNLQSKFIAFGVFAHLKLSFEIVARALGAEANYVKDESKVTRNRPAAADLSKEQKEELRRINWMDYELYPFALQLFERRYMNGSEEGSIRT